jgi:hypothetical protein
MIVAAGRTEPRFLEAFDGALSRVSRSTRRRSVAAIIGVAIKLPVVVDFASQAVVGGSFAFLPHLNPNFEGDNPIRID